MLKVNADEGFIQSKWKSIESGFISFQDDYKSWISEKSKQSDRFKYWSIFIDSIMPVIQDLTMSFRNGDWNLHLSAVRRALPLFFAFGHTNYCRWAPIYFEECKNLPNTFPTLYDAFCRGDFVVHHTRRKGSAAPIDQALEKSYNKPAKGPGGIIGFTRRKESVAKWNLVQHEKANFTTFIDNVCDLSDQDEFTIHYEFSKVKTKADEEKVGKIYK